MPHLVLRQCFGKPAASIVTLHASTMAMETARSSEMSSLIYQPHVTSQKTVMFIAIAVRTSNLTWAYKCHPRNEVISNLSYFKVKVRIDRKSMVACFYVTSVHVTQLIVSAGSNCSDNHVPVTSSSNILHCVCEYV